ncbi:hypothetical protein [Chitinimonas lacunae]|uniref:Uncharacterized protein n=1 Tax=Chitinimonas lacunae TaxID=1963018 RepID=A0ABV8MSJ2_9NEIS
MFHFVADEMQYLLQEIHLCVSQTQLETIAGDLAIATSNRRRDRGWLR